MKRLALVILTALTLGITGSASAQFGRNYWLLDADTLKVINPNWFIAAQNFIPVVGGTTNLFLGYQSGYSITSGTFNVGLGYRSFYNITSANEGVAIGYLAGYSWQNANGGEIAIGDSALYSNTHGSSIGIGTSALSQDTVLKSGSIAIGNYSQTNVRSGLGNVTLGSFTLPNDTAGIGNTIIGLNSYKYGTAGNYNTAVGINTINGLNTTGSYNCAFGQAALNNPSTASYSIAIGTHALLNDTSGSNNVAIGSYSGANLYSGSHNLFIGDSSGYNETGSNKLYIANSSTSSPLIYGDFTGDSLRVNGQLSSSGNIIGYGNATLSGNLTVNGTGTSSFAGNLGLGTASVLERLTVAGNVFVGGAASNEAQLNLDGYDYGIAKFTNKGLRIFTDSAVDMQFGTVSGATSYSTTESLFTPLMDLLPNGHVLIGTTTDNGHELQVNGSITAGSTILTGGYVSSASDQTFTNSTAQTNVTGLSVPLQANTTYSFTAQLFTSVAANAGEATSVYYGGNTPIYVIYGIVAEDSSVIDVSNWTNTIGTPFSDNVGSAVTPMIKVQGTITTGSTAANLTIRYAQSTAQTSSNTVKRGSWLHVWQTN